MNLEFKGDCQVKRSSDDANIYVTMSSFLQIYISYDQIFPPIGCCSQFCDLYLQQRENTHDKEERQTDQFIKDKTRQLDSPDQTITFIPAAQLKIQKSATSHEFSKQSILLTFSGSK